MSAKELNLYFIRHGETYFNLYDRVQGWGNTPLTELGVEDALRSGRGLKDIKFDAIYTSDLLRTVETADLILEENEQTAEDYEIIALPEFREFFFGSYEGGWNDDAFMAVADHLGYDSKEHLLEHVDSNARMDVFHEIDPHQHAESSTIFLERLKKGLDQVVEDSHGEHENVLIVAHGGTIHSLFELMIPDLENPPPLSNGSVSVVHYKDGHYEFNRYGDVSHFTD